MNKEEKIYTFNKYVLGYDKGQNDRSCLTISKIQNGNIYVMSSLYDGSAEIISTMLDSFQQELERYKNIINKTINFIESMEYCGQEDYFYDEQALDPCGNDNTFEQSKTKLLDILKGE